MVQLASAEIAASSKPSLRSEFSTRYLIGLAMLAVSAIVFFLPESMSSAQREDDAFAKFFVHFLMTVIYFFVGKNIVKGNGSYTKDRFVFLLLFLISAYALNRVISVFQETTTWLGVLLVGVAAVHLSLPYYSRLPKAAKYITGLIMGVGFVLWLYLSLYLVPVYPLSLVTALILGFSLNCFVPALFLIFSIKWLLRTSKDDRALAGSFGAGVVLSVSVITFYCVQWSQISHTVSKEYQSSLIDDSGDLPSWVRVARKLPESWIAKQFLKGDLVYNTSSEHNGFWDNPFSNGRFDETGKHDPLVMIASFFSGAGTLNKEERIKILESKYDARHNTEERLWSGLHLGTTSVITNANVWPARHLAYTEQIITVANTNNERWRPEEEAVYSFQLPEGSAVTSLSLWINGREEKAVLTTKGKAEHAYRQIVGREQRDPSLVQWAEGNRISVRVFPVVAGSNRIFKIGVTTPLIEKEGRLIYQPMWFEGPSIDKATGVIQLNIEGALANAKGLSSFTRDEQGRYKSEGNYDNYWSLSFDAPPLKPSSFSFNGCTYALSKYEPERTPVRTERVYLDLNRSWTKEEFDAVFDLAAGRKLYAYTNQVVVLNEDNRKSVFKATQRNEFSLFPFYLIDKPESSLVISKCSEKSPNLKDLQGSAFAEKLQLALSETPTYRLFSLDGQLSPYLKSLKERRVFRYEQGDVDDLKVLVERNVFASVAESDNSIVIDDAKMRLTKSAGTTASTGPDHLLRLYAYNDVIRHLGGQLYTSMEGDDKLVQEAAEANVVTPISSLIVLESAADYERFDIKQQGKNLANASVKSSGAVPEPHEWALIILSGMLLIWVRFRNQLSFLAFRIRG